MSSAVTVHLTGGALAKNVFWQVAGSVDLGTTSHLEGIVLCQTAINLRTGASINGRLLAQTAVNLDASTVTQPAPSSPTSLNWREATSWHPGYRISILDLWTTNFAVATAQLWGKYLRFLTSGS